MTELPSSRQIRFGRAITDAEPLLKLHNYGVITRALGRGSIGFAEAYVDGDIDCSDLTGLLRFFLRNRARFENSDRKLLKARIGDRIGHHLRQNSRPGSRRNIAEHYDLGNEFFQLCLDPDLIYSSGYYQSGACTLDQAQAAKLERIADFIQLSGGENVLEIGCGWMVLARYLVRHGAATVKSITLSQEQLAHAIGSSARTDLGCKCSFELCDYRDADGQFDRIVAIEMIEAVGEKYWPRFFKTLSNRLRPGGSAALQAITIEDKHFDAYPRKADFIQRYISPVACCQPPVRSSARRRQPA